MREKGNSSIFASTNQDTYHDQSFTLNMKDQWKLRTVGNVFYNNTQKAYFQNIPDKLKYFNARDSRSLAKEKLEYFGFEVFVNQSYYDKIHDLEVRLMRDVSIKEKAFKAYLNSYYDANSTADTADDYALVNSDAHFGKHTID